MAILKPAEINDQGAINPIDPGIRVRGYGARAPGVESRHVTGAFRVAGAAQNAEIALPDLSDKVWVVDVEDGGTYTGNITLEFDEPPAGGTRATGTAEFRTSGVDKIITGVNITNRGDGYTSTPNITITASGLILNDARLVVHRGPAALADDGVVLHVWEVAAAGNALQDLVHLTSRGQAARTIKVGKATNGKTLVVEYANPAS